MGQGPAAEEAVGGQSLGAEDWVRHLAEAGPLQLSFVATIKDGGSELYGFDGGSDLQVWLFAQHRRLHFDGDPWTWRFYGHTSKLSALSTDGVPIGIDSDAESVLSSNLVVGLSRSTEKTQETFGAATSDEIVHSIVRRLANRHEISWSLISDNAVGLCRTYPIAATCIALLVAASITTFLQLRYLRRFRKRSHG